MRERDEGYRVAQAATADEWIELCKRYRADCTALEDAGKHHTALYLAGYEAETAAKALSLERNPKPMKTHSLAALMDRAKMPLSSLTRDEHQYAMNRAVELRYELDLPHDWQTQIQASRRLAHRLCSELARRRKRSRR